MSVKIVEGERNWPTERLYLRGDAYPMGSPQGCLHAQSKDLHGKRSVGQRGEGPSELSGRKMIL